MELHDTGAKIFVSTDGGATDYTMLRYTDFILNNGDWRLIIFNYNMAAGKISLLSNTILHEEIQHSNLVENPGTFK